MSRKPPLEAEVVNGLTNVRPGIQVRVEMVPMPDISMPAKDGNKNVGVQK